MANGAVRTDSERLLLFERDNKWQNLFSKAALVTMFTVAAVLIGATVTLVFQLSSVNDGLFQLSENVQDMRAEVSVVKSDVSGLKSDVSVLQDNQNTILDRLEPPLQ